MVPVNSSADRSATTRSHQSQRLRTALRSLNRGMRELEEQLPLPADRRVRDNTPARQKARALRLDFEEFSLYMTQISHRLTATQRSEE